MSEVSEAEVREWLEEQGAGAAELGARAHHCSYPRLTSWRPLERARRFHLSLPLLFSWCASQFLGTGLGGGQRGACNATTARTADRKRTVHNLAMI